MSSEVPKIRDNYIHDLYEKLSKNIDSYLEKRKDMTNEELHAVFYRLEQFKIIQPSMYLYMKYLSDESVNKPEDGGIYK